MEYQINNLDYCGIVTLLRELLGTGICTEAEVKKVAARIAKKFDVDIIFPV